MRLPLDKVWRGFPELDRFSDAQCAAYVRLARRERVAEWLGVMTANVVIFVLGFAIIGFLGGAALDGFTNSTPAYLLATVVLIVLAVAAPLVLGLMLRDAWLRGAVRRHLRSARCPSCRYLLLGLPVRDGVVRCPECGDIISLELIGLTPADLIASSDVGQA